MCQQQVKGESLTVQGTNVKQSTQKTGEKKNLEVKSGRLYKNKIKLNIL